MDWLNRHSKTVEHMTQLSAEALRDRKRNHAAGLLRAAQRQRDMEAWRAVLHGLIDALRS